MSNRTYSAGGVVINDRGDILVVEEYGHYWGLPRGHIEPGETKKQAAIREIREEAGLTALEYVSVLGSYERSTFDKDGRDNHRELKHMTFFLFTTRQLDLQPQDKNITAARWVSPDQIIDLLIHPKDKDFYASVLPIIQHLT